ncbi:MAG: zinc-dependent dehydrogenase [Actinomycetota bacterium]
MKALFYKGKKKISVEDVAVPQISENEILLRVKAASVCATDLKIREFGHFKNPDDKPIILGHEFSGEIAKTGKDVKNLSEGMRVSIAPNIGCGHCPECIRGSTNLCENYEAFGISMNGAFAEFLRVPSGYITQGNIFILPDTMTFEEGALVEPLSAAFNGIESARINLSDIVLIIGAGPMGILNLMLAKLKGAQKVIVSEINPERIKIAEEAGADYIINPQKQDLKSRLMEFSYNRGPDAIIVSVSSAKAQEETLDNIARCGRIVFFGGLPKGIDTINFKSNVVHYKQVIVTGTTGSSIVQYNRSLELAASKKIDLNRLISKKFKLEDAEQAFSNAALPENLKVLFII